MLPKRNPPMITPDVPTTPLSSQSSNDGDEQKSKPAPTQSENEQSENEQSENAGDPPPLAAKLNLQKAEISPAQNEQFEAFLQHPPESADSSGEVHQLQTQQTINQPNSSDRDQNSENSDWRHRRNALLGIPELKASLSALSSKIGELAKAVTSEDCIPSRASTLAQLLGKLKLPLSAKSGTDTTYSYSAQLEIAASQSSAPADQNRLKISLRLTIVCNPQQRSCTAYVELRLSTRNAAATQSLLFLDGKTIYVSTSPPLLNDLMIRLSHRRSTRQQPEVLVGNGSLTLTFKPDELADADLTALCLQ